MLIGAEVKNIQLMVNYSLGFHLTFLIVYKVTDADAFKKQRIL